MSVCINTYMLKLQLIPAPIHIFVHCYFWSLIPINQHKSGTGLCVRKIGTRDQGRRVMSLRPAWFSLDSVNLGFTVRCCLKKKKKPKRVKR